MATEAFKRQVVGNPCASDEEAAQFLATNEWRYFETHWRPILPARVWTVLSVLHDHIRFDKTTWRKRETCWPSQAEIAARAHMNERTVNRILRRDAAGRFVYTYREQVYWIAGERDVARYVTRKTQSWQQDQARREQQRQAAQSDTPTRAEATATTLHKAITCPYQSGQLIAGKIDEIPDDYSGPVYALGDLMALFINKVDPRFHYNQGIGRWERTSNLYHVAAILPAVPDITAKNTLMINLADVRAARAKMQEEAAEQATPTATRAPTNWRVESTDNLTDEATFSKPCQGDDTSISHKGKGIVAVTIGKTESRQTGRKDDDAAESQQTSNRNDDANNVSQSNQIEISPVATLRGAAGVVEEMVAPARGRASPPPSAPGLRDEPLTTAPASAVLSETEIRLLQADAIAGPLIEQKAREVGDTNPRATRKHLIAALVAANAPYEVMVDTIRLAKNRIYRFQMAGGHVPAGKEGAYFLATGRNTVKAARKAGWDVGKLDAAERVKQEARVVGAKTPPASRPARNDGTRRTLESLPSRPASRSWGERELSHEEKLRQALYRNSH